MDTIQPEEMLTHAYEILKKIDINRQESVTIYCHLMKEEQSRGGGGCRNDILNEYNEVSNR